MKFMRDVFTSEIMNTIEFENVTQGPWLNQYGGLQREQTDGR